MLGQTHVCTHTGYDFGDEHQQPWERKTHTVVQHELIHAPGGSWPSQSANTQPTLTFPTTNKKQQEASVQLCLLQIFLRQSV